ncbi:MAG: hypothetical protein LBP51_02590 [Deferribacteraceae bacterium]|jgi:hypothetical protein|nr:hypothetical protein [Deferribacteraceae bacterium]
MNNWWKYGLVFIAGAVVGAAAVKNSEQLRSICTAALGGFLDLKEKAMETAETIKETAEDLIAETESKRKKGSA